MEDKELYQQNCSIVENRTCTHRKVVEPLFLTNISGVCYKIKVLITRGDFI